MTNPLKFVLVIFLRLHICANHHAKMTHCVLYTSHHDNKLQNTENFLYCLVGQYGRCPEIAFYCHKNAENEHNDTLNKEVQNWRLL